MKNVKVLQSRHAIRLERMMLVDLIYLLRDLADKLGTDDLTLTKSLKITVASNCSSSQLMLTSHNHICTLLWRETEEQTTRTRKVRKKYHRGRMGSGHTAAEYVFCINKLCAEQLYGKVEKWRARVVKTPSSLQCIFTVMHSM